MSKIAGIILRMINILVPNNSLRCTIVQQGVYLLTHIETGKIYVGSTGDLYERIHQHACSLLGKRHKNRNLQECFNSSKSFSLTFIETKWNDVGARFDIEQQWIDKLLPTGKLLNICLNSRMPWLGLKRPPSVSIAVSKANRERIFSQETREKMSNSRRGKKASPESILKRMASSPKDPIVINGVEYSTRREAERLLGLSRAAVTHRLQSKKDEYSGYVRKADLINAL